MSDFFENAWEFATNLLHSIWNSIKRFFTKLLSFFKNIVQFFKDPARLRKLKQNRNTIAVSIKENLDNGNYNVCNCLFDTDKEEVVDMEENAQGITAESIDSTTAQQFGNKNMLVLQ